jgi:FAD:protein FMN transferase
MKSHFIFAGLGRRAFLRRLYPAMLLATVLLPWMSATAQTVAVPSPASTNWYSESREIFFRIPIRITYCPENSNATARAWKYLECVNDIFNDFKPGSEISRINRLNAACETNVSPQLAEAFAKCLFAWQKSDGAFDITCGPLRNLWRKGQATNQVPTPEAIQAALAVSGMHRVTVGANSITLSKPGIQFDFGGIKGMFVDRVIEILKEGGATSALVQIGGETGAFGLSQKNRPYRVSIPNPTSHDEPWCVIHDPGTGFSGSTSGNYEQPIIINGQAYYHILNVKTGQPATTSVLSVSIAFPAAGKNWMADFMTKVGVLWGPERTFKLVNELGGEAMFLIMENGQTKEYKSSGWGKFE